MKRYLSLLPAVLLLLTACDPKSDRAAPLPKMVKVAEVVKAGNAQQRVFPARIESGDATDLAFKRAGQIETWTFAGVVVKQGQRLASLNDREARQRLNDRQTAATGSAAIRPLPDRQDAGPCRRPRWMSSAQTAILQTPRFRLHAKN